MSAEASSVSANGTTPPGGTGQGINAITALNSLPFAAIPEFLPGTTEVQEYTVKIKFVAKLWPQEQLHLLVQRAALNVKGSAFQKLMLNPTLLEGDPMKALENLCTALGGDWGIIQLEHSKNIQLPSGFTGLSLPAARVARWSQ